MSLIQRVTDLVNSMGEVTGDDLLPHCPGSTREQVLQALGNARYMGRIDRVRLGGHVLPNGGRGSQPSVWGPKSGRQAEPLETPTEPRGEYGIPRVSSVWQLGGQA